MSPLVEEFYNRCHGAGGKFCSTGGGGRSAGGSGGGKRRSGSGMRSHDREATANPTGKAYVQALTRALKEGKRIRIKDEPPEGFNTVNTLIKKVAAGANAAKAAGKKPTDIDLCHVTVPGTNLYCGANVGIPRKKMPQLAGEPVPGSKADKLPKSVDKVTGKVEVDTTEAFKEDMRKRGIKFESRTVPAESLKASQSQLDGNKVAGMAENKGYDPGKKPIFVSKDGYVIDGHHRWAAQVSRDLADGKTGDLPMHVIVVDMPIKQALKYVNDFATAYGIKPKSAKQNERSSGGRSQRTRSAKKPHHTKRG